MMMNRLYESYYNEALRLARDRDITGALEILRICIGLNKENVDALRLAGLCYYRLGNFTMAEKLLPNEELYANSGRDYDRALAAVAEYVRQGRHNEALELLIDNSRDSINDYNMIGCAYMITGKVKEARGYWRLVLSMDKNNRFALDCLAEDVNIGRIEIFLTRLRQIFKIPHAGSSRQRNH